LFSREQSFQQSCKTISYELKKAISTNQLRALYLSSWVLALAVTHPEPPHLLQISTLSEPRHFPATRSLKKIRQNQNKKGGRYVNLKRKKKRKQMKVGCEHSDKAQ